MTRTELVKKLRDTSQVMTSAAVQLRFYGAVSANAMKHAEELAGAAEMVGEWVDALLKEAKNEADK